MNRNDKKPAIRSKVCGVFALIRDKIIISQDFNGSYGIYLYENENEFIISNSFFKLVNYVKEDYTITLNKEYADAFIAADFCSLIYEETLVNEIRLLPKNYELSIFFKNIISI